MNGLFSLEGRVALVTGSAQGLGYTVARGMLDAGAKVVLNDVSPSALERARVSANLSQTHLQSRF